MLNKESFRSFVLEEAEKRRENLSSLSQFFSTKSKERYLALLEYTKFLDNNVHSKYKISSSFRLYCVINNINSIDDLPKCEVCGHIRLYRNFEKGFGLTCGKSKCNNSHPESVKKRMNSALNKYGSFKAAYHDTAKETIEEKYGAENVSSLDWVKEKKIRTSRRNWGTDYPWQTEEGKIRQKQGVIDKYNVDNVSQLEEIKEKKVSTSLENWGVENPSQSVEVRKRILESSGVPYFLPSGKIILVDGYEYYVLDYLLELYSEKDLEIQPEMSIEYEYQNKTHFWFPDVLIKTPENEKDILIEIKLLEFMSVELELIDKVKGGLRSGYNTFVYVVDSKDESLFKLYLNKEDKFEYLVIKDSNSEKSLVRYLDLMYSKREDSYATV